MRIILAFLFVVIAAFACQGPLVVTMLVFNDETDYKWTVSGVKADYLCIHLQSNKVNPYTTVVLGYKGFHVRDSTGKEFYAVNNAALEYAIYYSAPYSIPMDIEEHVLNFIAKPHACSSNNEGCYNPFFEVSIPNDKCDEVPLVGPDTVPDYDPLKDLFGCFVKKQIYNNCYNYANDIVTNTFAKPGRGSGRMFDHDDCDTVKAAAERDGLKWVGTATPTDQPAVGHYVSLMIWPERNFHWSRKDSNNMWSHKAGQTQVRDTDNSGKKIPDPAKADWHPWSTFCGYMSTVPSKVKVN